MQKIKGKVKAILPVAEGESARGAWVRGGVVIEYGDEMVRSVAFTAFGEDKVEKVRALRVGEPVEVAFNPESREFEGRWYTDLKLVKVESLATGQAAPAESKSEQDYLPY